PRRWSSWPPTGSRSGRDLRTWWDSRSRSSDGPSPTPEPGRTISSDGWRDGCARAALGVEGRDAGEGGDRALPAARFAPGEVAIGAGRGERLHLLLEDHLGLLVGLAGAGVARASLVVDHLERPRGQGRIGSRARVVSRRQDSELVAVSRPVSSQDTP